MRIKIPHQEAFVGWKNHWRWIWWIRWWWNPIEITRHVDLIPWNGGTSPIYIYICMWQVSNGVEKRTQTVWTCLEMGHTVCPVPQWELWGWWWLVCPTKCWIVSLFEPKQADNWDCYKTVDLIRSNVRKAIGSIYIIPKFAIFMGAFTTTRDSNTAPQEKWPKKRKGTSWVPRQLAAADVFAHSRPTRLEITHEPSAKLAFLSQLLWFCSVMLCNIEQKINPRLLWNIVKPAGLKRLGGSCSPEIL